MKVPGFDGALYVREMSGVDRERYELGITSGAQDKGHVRAMLVACTLCDEQGKLLFGPDQVAEIASWKVRVLIPPRFRELSDDPDGIDVTRRVTQALERFRPAGVEVETRFIDERWELGAGTLTDGEGASALALLTGGTVLWPAPDAAEQPGPPA